MEKAAVKNKTRLLAGCVETLDYVCDVWKGLHLRIGNWVGVGKAYNVRASPHPHGIRPVFIATSL